MTRQERLLRLARLRGDRAAELIVETRTAAGPQQVQHPRSSAWVRNGDSRPQLERHGHGITGPSTAHALRVAHHWTEAELRAAWGDR